jgi:asparagine synthase (glutamine-hydrolysing)
VCGIAGVVAPEGVHHPDLTAMANALAHRGPDSHGFLLHGEAGLRLTDGPAADGEPNDVVGLAHRRLTIIDVSDESDQPMVDPTGRYAITYNGELYNYLELRDELAGLGHEFNTSGDTEVVLRAYAEWGPNCVERFIGMWAFGMLDLKRGSVLLSRDRFGIKPLHYAVVGDALYFASEIKGLLAAQAIDAVPDEAAVARFLFDGRTDEGDRTFFRGIRRLDAAHNLDVPLASPASASTTRYWRIPLSGRVADADAPRRYRELFADAVRLHARADVPVGTCLSGGLDSSAIVCVAAELRAAGEVPEYAHAAVGYLPAGGEFSERPYMEAVVAATGVRMNYVSPSSDEFAAALPEILRLQDEPFATASIAAQWFVFARAREAGLKVMLDGQGADEVLAGYPSYLAEHARILLRGRRLRALARLSRTHRAAFGRAPLGRGAMVLGLLPRPLRDLVRAARDRLRPRSPDPVLALAPTLAACRPRLQEPESASLTEHLAAQTSSDNLPALLRFEDRNSMGHSIEARVPFLDHRLVELSFALVDEWKLRGIETKRVLREALADTIPAAVRARKDKIGFRADPGATFAIASAHRDSLAAAGSEYERRWLDPGAVRRLLVSPDRSPEAEFRLWRLICLKLWLREFWGDGGEAPG